MRTARAPLLKPPSRVRAFAPYLLYYNGAPSPLSLYQIGVAQSSDNINWTRLGGVLQASASGWDSTGVKDPCVLRLGAADYRMWYSGYLTSGTATFQIGYATSTDGVHWVKSASNPVVALGTTGTWDANNCSAPCVFYDPSDVSRPFKMWYQGVGTSGIASAGYAYSTDGISWTKSSANPVLSPGSAGTYDAFGVNLLCLVKSGSTYYGFYNGNPTDGSSGMSGTQGCLATFTDPEGTYTKSASNPLLSPSTAKQTLTADLTSGTTTVTVADTSAFHAGEPCLLLDNTNAVSDCYVQTINSGTQMTLKAGVSTSYTTAHSSTIRSFYYGSVEFRSILPTPTGYVMYIDPFQQFAGTPVMERSAAAVASSLTGAWSYDYTRGIVLPVVSGSWDSASAENPWAIAAG